MAAVSPVASVEALLSAIQKSGLLSAEALGKVRESPVKATEPKQLARELVKNGTLTRWQAEQLLHGYHRLIVGKYKLLDQIAASPTGRIYLAEHVQIGRRHALKVLAKRLASNPQAVKRFLVAAQTACGLDHRNVSHCYDVSQDHERHSHYVVMEYVEGESLERLVERTGRLDPPLALNFAVQAADGLAHAHQNGVVHGDLKPANLILDPTDTIKILEMGQASSGAAFEAEGADDAVEMAALAAVIFQPPELRGDGETADVACDVYSLGSVLTYLLTAKAAADAATAVERLKEHADVPPELANLCQRMMADKPADRPKTISDVADELVACAQKMAAGEATASASNSAVRSATSTHERPSASGKGSAKAKKPPVAKPLDAASGPSIVIPGVTHPVVEPTAPESFAIKTRGRIGKKPAATPAAVPDGVSKVEGPATKDAPTGMTPLVLAGAIGGGAILVIGLLIAVICLLVVASRRAKPAATTVPAIVETSAPSATTAASQAESNPLPPVEEQNPEVKPSPAATASSRVAAEPENGSTQRQAEGATLSTPEVTATVPPTPLEADPTLAPSPAPQPAAPEVATKTIAPPATQIASKPSPAAAKQASKPPAKAEPFKGLATAVTLPPLVEPNGQAAVQPSALVLGPCKLDDKTVLEAKLAGGDTAVRGTKHRFELQPKAEEKNAWNFLMTGAGMPSSIASLWAAEGKLHFQWTDDGGKQAALAKQLCNCALQLTAGNAKHPLALRTAVIGQPLMVDLDKPGAATRWAIGDLPPGKQLFVEVIRAEGPKGISLEPKQPVTTGEEVSVWFGESDKMLPLFIKLGTTTNSRDLEIRQQPYVKLEGQEPRLYRRKELQGLHQQAMQQLAILDPELKKTKDSRPRAEIEKKLKEQKLELLTKQRLDLGTVLEQINFATGFTEDYKGAALVHLRVYYQAGEEKVELLRTTEPGPAKTK